ncbi:MAG: hypothetical protein SNJ70_11300, partial [Armatimonadota bacterium]
MLILRITTCLFILFLLSTPLLSSVGTSSYESDSKVVVIVAGNLSIRDFQNDNLVNILNLIESSSIGLMNIRSGRMSGLVLSGREWGMEAGCVTLGAGTPAVGGKEVRFAGDVESVLNHKNIGELYKFRTGKDYGDAEIVQPEIYAINKANARSSYRAIPGLLGQSIRNAGKKTAVIGISDILNVPYREVAAIAFDSNGIIDYGNLNSNKLSIKDETMPYGVRTNINALTKAFEDLYKKADFIVVNYADTMRADAYSIYCTTSEIENIRNNAIIGLDELVGNIKSKINPNDYMMIVSPSYRTALSLNYERLTPIIISGDCFERGFITSSSTRKKGLVTISDFAPTVLTLMGIEYPKDMSGRPCIHIASEGNNLEYLAQLNDKASYQRERTSAMRGGSVVQSVLVFIISIFAFLSINKKINLKIEWLAIVPAVIPLVMLLIPALYDGGLAVSSILLIVLCLSVLLILKAFTENTFTAYTFISLVLSAGLMIDIFRGSPLISNSIAGYSIIEGARYYGIGNELMGSLLGAVLIGCALFFHQNKLSVKMQTIIAAFVFAFVFI